MTKRDENAKVPKCENLKTKKWKFKRKNQRHRQNKSRSRWPSLFSHPWCFAHSTFKRAGRLLTRGKWYSVLKLLYLMLPSPLIHTNSTERILVLRSTLAQEERRHDDDFVLLRRFPFSIFIFPFREFVTRQGKCRREYTGQRSPQLKTSEFLAFIHSVSQHIVWSPPVTL